MLRTKTQSFTKPHQQRLPLQNNTGMRLTVSQSKVPKAV